MRWYLKMAKLDDICGVCGIQRDMHGDKNHVFRLDDMLIPKAPAPEPRKKAPKHRDDDPQPSSGPDVGKAFATLVEVLAEKGLLNHKDIIRIFSGQG